MTRSVPAKGRAGAARRVRRTPLEARRQILDAAERRLADGGPEAIRLQDIARDVGISHPAILHHFQSRDGLTKALAERAVQRLADDLLAVLRQRDGTEASAREVIERVFATLADTGHARLLAWRALAQPPRTDDPEARARLDAITDAIQARREELARERGTAVPDREDTTFIVRLATTTMLGEALTAPIFAPGSPRTARDSNLRFRRWLADLLTEHAGFVEVRRSRRKGS
jgi:TetR/AcrR family transcriptional regulator, repressor for neighboring sulfatase